MRRATFRGYKLGIEPGPDGVAKSRQLARRPKPKRKPVMPPQLASPLPAVTHRDDEKLSGAAVIRWIEKNCYVPEGKHIGQKFKLDDWQKAEICRIYDNPAGTRRAILSFGRKNGKTSLAAVLMLVHLCGIAARPNSSMYSTAQSREQAALIFNLAAKILRMSPNLRDSVTIKDSTKEIDCHEIGTHYRALSAEASTAYGLSPVFVVHDELGQVRGPRSKLYEALETATGAQENPLSIIISTQAPSDSDLLSILIEDALAGHDPRVICKLYTAGITLDPFDEATIRLANPAFGTFLNPTEVMAMADDAKRMPSREAEFRNLILNQRIEAVSQFIAPTVWAKCGAPVGDLTKCREVYGGLDLSETNDLTALVLIGKLNDIWHTRCWFWMPGENLFERAKVDHVPYDLWFNQGFLETVPGAAITYDLLAKRVCEILAEYPGLQKIAFDRWNYVHLKPWLSQNGWSNSKLEQKWVEFGQGIQSMSPALRELESRILRKEIAHGNNPILTMCCCNAVVEGNKNGTLTKDSSTRKLSKKRSSGRIDGMVALAMATGVAPQGARISIEALIG